MSPARCPVCGASGGTCHGDAPFDEAKIITAPLVPVISTGGIAVAEDTKVYLPKQRTRIGKAGYRGKDIVVVDKDGKKAAAPTKKKADE